MNQTNPNQPTLEELLTAGRTSGVATAQSLVTGREVTLHVPLDAEAKRIKPIDKDVPLSSVSLEGYFHRDLRYHKVSVKVWMHSPCNRGEEEAELDRLAAIAGEKAIEYADKAFQQLVNWVGPQDNQG